MTWSQTPWHSNKSTQTLAPLLLYIYIYIAGWGESGFNYWGSGDMFLCYSCFTWMYLECAHSLTSPSSLERYQLLGFSSTSGGLSSWLNGSTLDVCLPFPCREYWGWAKTHLFLFTPTFLCFLIFFLLLSHQQYSTFECWQLGLLLNNKKYITMVWS